MADAASEDRDPPVPDYAERVKTETLDAGPDDGWVWFTDGRQIPLAQLVINYWSWDGTTAMKNVPMVEVEDVLIDARTLDGYDGWSFD